MMTMFRGAQQVSWRSPQISASVLDLPSRQASGGYATVGALAAFLPVWLSRPLLLGEFSFAFAVPFLLAFWALTRPAWPGTFRRAMQGGHGRGLWLEALCVGTIVMLAFISILDSPAPLRAFRVILPMAYAPCALILLSRVPPLVQRRLLFAALFSGTIVLAFALLLTQIGSGRSIVMLEYRFRAFLENSNQLGVMILAVWPLAIALLLNAQTGRQRLLCTITVLILATATFLSGTKTALALGFVSGALTWLYHGSRSGSLDKTLFKLVIVVCAIVLAVPTTLWVLSWASPDAFKRVENIIAHGIWEYNSMQDRNKIWTESVQIGLAHPLLGAGAGTKVLGYAHSHNMFADYFRGMGVFGLSAAIALVVSTTSRGANFLLSTLHKGMTNRPSDTIVVGLYLGAIFYLIGNLLSDSFSPTTSFLYWMVYLGAYFTTLPLASAARPVRRPSTLGWAQREKRRGERPVVVQPS